MATGRDKHASRSLGSTLHARIKRARVLMVGAGGIGCELLKNLVLTGFGEIHIVDLDTIDLSNLNRQFLFRKEHIKKSKALVAKESAGKFNPNVKIEAYHDNIKDPSFNVAWFSKFDIVFNALDNLEARRHVNKMCLAADVPLIESGTTGFNGQVQVIQKGKTQCYDCTPKDAPKSFPVCTIRSTPSQPIHCIVWAKSYLFTEIFGTSEDDAPELDHSEDSENRKEIENLRNESQALKRIRESMGSEEFPKLVFDKVFKEDIERLRSMEDMWRTRKAPNALHYEDLLKEVTGVEKNIAQKDQAAWTVTENFAVFLHSLRRLSNRMEETKANADTGNSSPILTFDKDDVDTLDFVAASANLRSIIFGIEGRSKFDIKQMAGNIIPAIATTNAMTASICVLQSFKVMRAVMAKDELGAKLKDESSEKSSKAEVKEEQIEAKTDEAFSQKISKAKMVFLAPNGTERRLTTEGLSPPNPCCPVCSVAQSTIVVDANRATLNDLVEDLLRLQLGYGEEFSVNSEAGLLYDPEEDANLNKTFAELGLNNDASITIIDDADEGARVNLVLHISEQHLGTEAKPIDLTQKPEIPLKPKAAPTETNGDSRPIVTNGLTNGVTNGATNGLKRTAKEAGLKDELVRKRGKVVAESDDDDFVIVDDANDGVICIDDD
ncbi:ubiquitin-activating enzyme E1 3 [Karstenula rhodostoma CBS 690.94]|uniref:Ubiquitin-activating enzyme E1-like n=1 Tax=Karstenula rhodostoma CBS 690.94 TaxID=1392251 RepID=A0A9P4UGA3_9PLEO|nr:ubiquitin-activating enzyme E1 3 [Karstenula rhodostoma CBS 690.94]